MRTIEEIKANIKQMGALEPEIGERSCLQRELYRAITDSIPLDRLEEICNAEREGRCVVLPCRVGDTVYFIKSCFSYAKSPMRGTVCMIKTFSERNTFTFGVIMEGSNQERSFTAFDIGKTAFLTREAAEQALKEREQDEQV